MGSCGRSDAVDESLCGSLLPLNSDCLLLVEGDLGNKSENSEIGLSDKSRDCEVCENVGLEQNSYSNCSGDSTDHLFIGKVLCSETACLSSNSMDQQKVFLSQNFDTMNSGIDHEVSLVGKDHHEDVHDKTAFLVSDQLPSIEFGVTSDKGNQTGCSGSIEEPCLVQTVEIPVVSSSSLTMTLTKCSPPKEEGDTKNVVGFLEETGTDSLGSADEKHDVLAGALIGSKTQTLDLGENSCNLIGGTPNIASDCAIEVSLPLTTSPSKWTQPMEHEDTKNVIVSSEEMGTDSLGLADEQLDVLVGISTRSKIQTPDLEENNCNSIGGTPNIASDCAIGVSSSLITSPSKCTQPMEQKDAKNVSGFLEETSTDSLGPTDEKHDVLAGTLTGLKTQTPDLERNDCNLVAGTPNIASGVVVGDSSRNLTSDGKEIDGLGGVLVCNGVVDSTGLPDNEGKEIMCSSSRRSTRRSKVYQRKETRKTARQCRQTANKKFSSDRTIGISLKIVKRKRSCPCKQARSSVWGALENILRVFTENELVQLESHVSRKRKGRNGSKRRQKSQAGGGRLKSKGKGFASSSGIRLKVKMEGQGPQRSLKIVLSDMLDSPALAPTVISECALEPDCQIGVEISELANGILDKSEEHVHDTQFTSLGACVIDSRHVDKDLESSVTQEMSVGNTSGDALEEAVRTRYSDPGTSPDSEVINLIQDVGIGVRVHEDLHDALLTSPQPVDPFDATTFNVKSTSSKKGKKKGKIKGTTYPSAGCFAAEEKLSGEGSRNKSRKLAKRRPGNASGNPSSIEMLKVEPVTKIGEFSCQDTEIKPLESVTTEGLVDMGKSVGLKPPKGSKSNVKVSKRRSRAPDSARRRRGNVHEQKKKDIQKSANKSRVKEKGCLGQVVNNGENHLATVGDVNICLGTREHSEVRELGINVVGPEIFDDPGKSNMENKIASEDIFKSSMVSSGLEGQFLPPRNAWVRCDDCHKWRCISAALADSIEETNCTWTCKENMDKAFADCSIPQEKTNEEINAELEISGASCEEDASDAYRNSKGFECKQFAVSQRAAWKLIKSNLFLHRNRKSQTIDEIMVCHCKSPLNGNLSCGDECLNRMLNIECVRGTCPCGDLCSNQQFQKRKYAKLKWFRCGKKGYGLQVLENVSEGKFLIEYVGEVLDLHTYDARQREYASRGQKHFYFMTLNGNEVIDACAKGNLGRFINHSCDPNCRTEKWMVNGEVCIGLFAIRDIKKGEEVTFDYNYVRVFGAAAKKCVCGSSECRGYIGGDPLNTEVVVQGDSDEEYPEPVMVHEDDDNEECMDKMISNTGSTDGASLQHAEIFLQTADTMIKSPSASAQETSSENEDSMSRSLAFVQPLEISLPMEGTMGKSVSAIQSPEMSLQTEDVMNKSSFSVQPLEISLQKDDTLNKTLPTIQSLETSSPIASNMGKSVSHSVAAKSKSTSDTVEDKPNISKARPLMKSSRYSSSIKKGKSISHSVVANKPQVLANKPKKLLEGAAGSRLDGVEDKLNELLDVDGGISRRKDATKGYLKLLLVTAASGDNANGEAVQSTRDLSIILDALLKTKSRMVLVDIINKNGLQMLHNIMKQNRRNFNKTPIIRKLLKVLEFLALGEILTLEHINSDPPCAGIESFKESILKLTWHNDVQVHQIARNFRDKWIPRAFRRISYSDRDDIKLEVPSGPDSNWSSTSYKRWHDQGARSTEAIDCVRQAVLGATLLDTDNQQGSPRSSLAGCSTNGAKTRKRKSRWDQPTENPDQLSPELMEDKKMKHKLDPNAQQPKINEEEKICNGCDSTLSQQAENGSSVDVMQCIHEDAPPGFPSLLNSPPVPSDTLVTTTVNLPSQQNHHRSDASEVVTACLQGRYLSHLPVSYGIPLSFVERLGIPHEEMADGWCVAPAIPFHPFPPLPPFPRNKSNGPPSSAMTTNGRREEGHRDSHCPSPCEGDPSTSGSRPPDWSPSRANNQHMVERMRCTSGSIGRRQFRQQNWNNVKCPPPWVRRRNGFGFRANNSRSGVYNVGFGNVENESRSFCSEGLSVGGDNVSSTFYQPPRRQFDR